MICFIKLFSFASFCNSKLCLRKWVTNFLSKFQNNQSNLVMDRFSFDIDNVAVEYPSNILQGPTPRNVATSANRPSFLSRPSFKSHLLKRNCVRSRHVRVYTLRYFYLFYLLSKLYTIIGSDAVLSSVYWNHYLLLLLLLSSSSRLLYYCIIMAQRSLSEKREKEKKTIYLFINSYGLCHRLLAVTRTVRTRMIYIALGDVLPYP